MIGSIIIVLHAPPDKEVETVDEILKYAIKIRKLECCSDMLLYQLFLNFYPSFSPLHRSCYRLLSIYDLQDRACLWSKKPPNIPVYLLHRRFDIDHGYQSLWHRRQAYFLWEQPIWPS